MVYKNWMSICEDVVLYIQLLPTLSSDVVMMSSRLLKSSFRREFSHIIFLLPIYFLPRTIYCGYLPYDVAFRAGTSRDVLSSILKTRTLATIVTAYSWLSEAVIMYHHHYHHFNRHLYIDATFTNIHYTKSAIARKLCRVNYRMDIGIKPVSRTTTPLG